MKPKSKPRHFNPAVNSAVQFIICHARQTALRCQLGNPLWLPPKCCSECRLHSGWSPGDDQLSSHQFRAFFQWPNMLWNERLCFCFIFKRLLRYSGDVKKRPSSDCAVPAPGRVQHPARCCLACSAARTCYSCICSRAEFPSLLGYRTVFSSPSLSYLQTEDEKGVIDVSWTSTNFSGRFQSPADWTGFSPMVSALLKWRVTTLSMLSFSHKLSSSK